MLPDVHTQHTTRDIASCSNHSTCWMDEARKKMRPDMMIIEMTHTEQRTYLSHDTDTGSRLPNLQRTMPNGKFKARKVTIVEGGYCSDVSYLEKVKEKGQQHARLEEAEERKKRKSTLLSVITGTKQLLSSPGADDQSEGLTRDLSNGYHRFLLR